MPRALLTHAELQDPSRGKPRLDDLVTTTDIGRMLGITRSGAQRLSEDARDFPLPIGKLGHYVVWWRPEIAAWIFQRYVPGHNAGRRLRRRAA